MHPVLFKVPLLGWEIYSFGVLLGLSLLIAWFLTHWLAKRVGLPRETIADAFVIAALGGLVGARVQYVLTNLEEFANPIAVLRIGEGGLAAYGGLIGGVLASWLYLRRKKLSTLAWLDVATPSVMIGVALTRIGCFLHGCDFGSVAERRSWAVQFPAGTPAYEWHERLRWLPPGEAWSLPVHPVQLYTAASGLILLALTLLAWRVRRFSGQVFLLGTMAYGGATFATELFRGDPHRGWLWMWSTSQVIAVATTAAALAGYVLRWRCCQRDPADALCLGPGIDAARADDAESDEG